MLLLLLPTSVSADEVLTRFTPRVHTMDDGDTLPYRWYQSTDATTEKQVPLVILLHGTSGRGTDNERQLTAANRAAITFLWGQRDRPCAIAVPQCPPDDQWVKTDYHPERHLRPERPGPTMHKLLTLVHHLREEPAIDRTRVYVIGNSMGGYGTWDLISRERLIAAAIPICGGGNPDDVLRGVHIPTWAFHGAQDPIVAVGHSRRLVAAARAVDVTIDYTEFADAGHDITERVFATPGLADWLFTKQLP